MAAQIRITEYTDPGCPFAYSAEPSRMRLRWLYGDALEWEVVLVGLATSRQEYADKGLTPEMLSAGMAKLAHEHHMPMDTALRPAVAATLPACRAVVAARVHAPDAMPALLRHLRVRHHSGQLLDDDATIDGAARDAGLDPAQLRGWMAGDDVAAALADDLDRARHPSAAALALDHKLASWEEGRRYTCPSYEVVHLGDARALAAPGFQPTAAYEVLIANLAPDLERRPAPDSAEEVLAWADTPLATQEVAAIREIDFDDAHEELSRVATLDPLGYDGFWTLAAAA